MTSKAAAKRRPSSSKTLSTLADAAVGELLADGSFGPSRDPATPDLRWVRIDEVKAWPDNPRINRASIARVQASIEKFGWVRPLVANTHPDCPGELIIGHTAWEAAKAMKAALVPVRFRRMEPSLAHAAALADNRLNEIAEWDYAKLGELAEMGSITQDLFDVAGFDAKAYEALLNRETGDFLAGAIGDGTPPPSTNNERPGASGFSQVAFTVTTKEKSDILAALSAVDAKATPSQALVKLCRETLKARKRGSN